MHRGQLDIKHTKRILKLRMINPRLEYNYFQAWALQIMRKVFRVVCRCHTACIVHPFPTVMSDEHNTGDKTCSRLIT